MKNTLVINSLLDDPLPKIKMLVIAGCIVFAIISLISPVKAQENAKNNENTQENIRFADFLLNNIRKNTEKLAKQSEIDGRKTLSLTEKVQKIGLKNVQNDSFGYKNLFSLKNKENKEELMIETIIEPVKPDKIVFTVMSAYTSTPDQTDDSPFIAASGKRVYDGMVAANWLPFGTKIKIPELYGDKIFTVDDRMNKRYGFGRMDIWLDTSRAEAMKFGVKRFNIEIYYDHPEDKVLAKAE
jgi:hypothetical protein